MTKADTHKWEFKARFRRHAFGWKSQPAITRVKQAVTEIRKVARKEPVVAAEGAVTFFERLSPALEQIDSSSGAIGTAVGHAIEELVPVIGGAPASREVREAWLERLFEAHESDDIPYIERLADYWGDLCASEEIASTWADRLLPITRMAIGEDPSLRGHFHGTTACLSALYAAGRFDEIVALVRDDLIWPYRSWVVKALAAMGQKAEALRYAESCRSPWTNDFEVDSICEEIFLSSGLIEEAWSRYGLRANRRSTYLATFRAVASKYPHKTAGEILAGLVATTPGDEGKWFAAAKEAGLFDEALALARRTPCDPRTLARATRDHVEKRPEFAVNAGFLALHWLAEGYGYDITSVDVLEAYRPTMEAAARLGVAAEVKERIRALTTSPGLGVRFLSQILRRELE